MTMEKKSPEEGLESREIWRIVKNVVVIGLAFMLLFTGYLGAINLQSSINAEDGLSTASLAAVRAGLIFSNLFLPQVFIHLLGEKWAIFLSIIMYMPYIAEQLWPHSWKMIPAGLIVGLGAGPLWCAKCIYLSVVSEAYSKISKIPAEALLVRFLGLFFMLAQMSLVWSHLISFLVLSPGTKTTAVTALNASQISELGGSNSLPSFGAKEALEAQPQKIEMLVGIYLACIAGALIIVAVGVDSLKRYVTNRAVASTDTSCLAILFDTIKLLLEPNQMMIIIITMFVGYQQAVFSADFTPAFAHSTGTIGFVMMTYGMADAIGCVVTGYLTKVTGRLPWICCAAVVNAALFTFLLSWQPRAQHGYALYAVAALWGLCDSVWMVQINAYCGILFPHRKLAAFSNFRLWLSVGQYIACVSPSHLQIRNKIFILLAMMVTGVIMYFIVEFKEWKKRKTLSFFRAVYRFAERTQ